MRLRITYLLSTTINTSITLSFIFSNSASLFWRYLLTSKSAASLASLSFRDLGYDGGKIRKRTGEFVQNGLPLFLGVLDDVVSFFFGLEQFVNVGCFTHQIEISFG